MSRLAAIRAAVEIHVDTGFSGITIVNEPVAFDQFSADELPVAVVVFSEAEPERLAFKQERRRVNGVVAVGLLIAEDSSIEATREIMNQGLQDIRDAIYGDEDLTGIVDDVSCDAGVAYSSRDETMVYGQLDIATEEIF
jgi:hypothetical protein